ncbi:MAG TPA: CbiX/SirB N-terminal domain-containing protein [Mycobacteriales bacterium]|nr:CbiX/SirB N-terminal domain-containing protein [Mycobacteriales bacterium]
MPPCVLAAHGSTDPGYAEIVARLAVRVAQALPDVDVRIGFLDHGPPFVREVADPGSVVVPLLLAGGFHARTDLPEQAQGCLITPPIGPDAGLAQVLSDRLAEAGWNGTQSVLLAAASSTDPQSADDVGRMARWLGESVGQAVEVALIDAAGIPVGERGPEAVATYVLGPGRFASSIMTCGAAVIAAPLGDHPLIAEIIVTRYGRTAPM